MNEKFNIPVCLVLLQGLDVVKSWQTTLAAAACQAPVLNLVFISGTFAQGITSLADEDEQNNKKYSSKFCPH